MNPGVGYFTRDRWVLKILTGNGGHELVDCVKIFYIV